MTKPNGFVTELRMRGYAVLPVPRQVELESGSVRLDGGWGLATSKVAAKDIAVRTLTGALADEYGVKLAKGKKPRTVSLALRPGTVKTGTKDGRDGQAYELVISPKRISVTGNGLPGVFYGVQTLLQLMDGDGSGQGLLPAGRIVDWPQFDLRCSHWDTKHHQDRMETMKRSLDQAARFKINGVVYEIEDKFEYPSHPLIGVPGAWTTVELQEIVDYALERHIEFIPDVQSPAHMAYVLKHEEFAHLRCDGSNYQMCMDKPEVRKFLFDMYDDVCAATKGCKYFHVSTDEVYYAGICEKFRKPYNEENRSLTWVDYVNAAHAHVSKKGRRVIVWGEYPLIEKHVKLLPKGLINGVGGRGYAAEEDKRGIGAFWYVSMQGVELLMPSYFAWVDAEGRRMAGRLQGAADSIASAAARLPNAIGTISAAWDDSGPHSETFWLGWVLSAQASWTPGLPAEEFAASFFDLFYGRGTDDMAEVYRDLQAGARFYEGSLERLPSTVRKPGYGEWDEKRPLPRMDRGMVPPGLPDAKDLAMTPVFRPRYARALGEAPKRLVENDGLLLALESNLVRARRNRHNLEVFISLAYLQRHHIEMLLGVGEAEDLLVRASVAAKKGEHEAAVNCLMDAHQKVRGIVEDLYLTYAKVKAVWEKGRFEKGRSVGGRKFVHIMDDVKDHMGDRRPDLTYLISPEERIGLRGWLEGLRAVIHSYAAKHGIKASVTPEAPLNE